MMSLVFDGMGNTHIRNRVEAFVYRVKRYKEEREKAAQLEAEQGR